MNRSPLPLSDMHSFWNPATLDFHTVTLQKKETTQCHAWFCLPHSIVRNNKTPPSSLYFSQWKVQCCWWSLFTQFRWKSWAKKQTNSGVWNLGFIARPHSIFPLYATLSSLSFFLMIFLHYWIRFSSLSLYRNHSNSNIRTHSYPSTWYHQPSVVSSIDCYNESSGRGRKDTLLVCNMDLIITLTLEHY